jgi:hypothetical protein
MKCYSSDQVRRSEILNYVIREPLMIRQASAPAASGFAGNQQGYRSSKAGRLTVQSDFAERDGTLTLRLKKESWN